MTNSAEAGILPLADILDSKPGLREILARNPNLAHACLLLRRGEADAVEKALDLASREADPEAQVIGDCIRSELSRLAGRTEEAVERIEVLARDNRFHPAAALCLRNLFPLLPASQTSPTPPVLEAAAPTDSLVEESQAVEVSAISIDPSEDEPEPSHGLPAPWNPIAVDPAVLFLRLRDEKGVSEHHPAGIAADAVEAEAMTRAGDLLARLGFGELRHAAFEGTLRAVHAWKHGPRSALAVLATGGSTSLLAARCTKSFQDAVE